MKKQISKWQNGWITATAVVLSVCIVFGKQMENGKRLRALVSGPAACASTVLKLFAIGACCYIAVRVLFYAVEKRSLTAVVKEVVPDGMQGRNNGLVRLLRNHPFGLFFGILLLLWLPYLIAYYPGIFMGDTGAQISMFYQLQNAVSESVNLVSPSQLITNHHPVLHTLLLGGCVKIGQLLFHSDNKGIFLYTILQVFFCIFSYAYTVAWLRRRKMPKLLWIAALFFFALCPIFPRYGMLLSKDAYFTCFVLLFVLKLLDLLEKPDSFWKKKKEVFFLLFATLGTLLFRQNGILVILFALPPIVVLLQTRKRERRRAMAVLLGCVVFYAFYLSVLLPLFGISSGSKREILSVPFQQTARYIRTYPDEVTKEEYESINAVLDYEQIQYNYDQEKADPVKNTYRKDATDVELKRYFKTWFQMFKKHPRVYVSSFVHNYYGYLVVGDDSYHKYTSYYGNLSQKFMDTRINWKGFCFHHLQRMEGLRTYIEMGTDLIWSLPILSDFRAAGFYCWGLLLAGVYLVCQKRYDRLLLLLPATSLFLTCFIAPVNGIYYFRYSLPLAALLPVTFSTCLEETALKAKKK